MSMRNLGLPWNEGEHFSKCRNKVRDGSVYVAELNTFFPLRLWTFEGQCPKDGLTIFSVSSMFPSGIEAFAFHALCLPGCGRIPFATSRCLCPRSNNRVAAPSKRRLKTIVPYTQQMPTNRTCYREINSSKGNFDSKRLVVQSCSSW